jgi:hypothetical protein
MRKRLLCLGLVAFITQLTGTGCLLFHPIERWRTNHPCGTYNHHPLLHPIQTRRAIFQSEANNPVGPAVNGMAPCHGCPTPGVPVSYGPVPHDYLVPVTNPPTIGQPIPLNPGPKVYPLPTPMEAPKTNGQ